jgi:glycosyltransferase involved in cell wall biosynthesis
MPGNEPRISVVICTHNRADSLCEALDSLERQTLSPRAFEVVVVDNLSTDGTRAVVESFTGRMANLHVVREGRLGLSWARNAGAAAAHAACVVYLDDDARASPGWLQAMLGAFERTTPAPGCVGGRVWLDWRGPRPRWLPSPYDMYYTCLDLGNESRAFADREAPVGANVGFRKDALEAVGGFPTDLGRKGASLLSCEEVEVIRAIRDRGLGLYYAADAAVFHTVPRARQKRRWLLSRVFWEGVSHALMNGQRRGPREALRQAYWGTRQLLRLGTRYGWSLVSAGQDKQFACLVDLVMRCGTVGTGIWLSLRGPRQPDARRQRLPQHGPLDRAGDARRPTAGVSTGGTVG